MAERDPVTSGLLIRSTTGDARINPLQRAADRAADAMIRYSGEFGFSPAARARIAAGVGGFSPQAPSKFDGLPKNKPRTHAARLVGPIHANADRLGRDARAGRSLKVSL